MDVFSNLYAVAELRELDRRAIAGGIPAAELMARAGAAALRVLQARFPRARQVAVACGPGNNGGDGYVFARLARAAGIEPLVFALGDPARASLEATAARVQAEGAGVVTQPFTAQRVADADVIVDGLLGIGLERPVRGEWRAVIEMLNAARRPVLALDVPSGLHADTGAVMGAALRAELTVSFIGLKAGLYTGAGREYAGEILLDDLGVPPEVYAGLPVAGQRLHEDVLRGLLPRRARDTHKGSFGGVLVLGGNRGMGGAARLCGAAACRCGAGLVMLAVHPDHAAADTATPEMLVYPVRTIKDAQARFDRASVLALGPGLGQDAWAQRLFRAALDAELPMVIDADALNLLAQKPRKRADWILTPHPGEAARLLGVDTAEVQRDRFGAVRAIARRYGGVCVLKGSGTLIATDDGQPPWLCDRGNPGMASGGMGDALTGAMAALRAQGLAALDAARLGVWLHATAADSCARREGEVGLLARDLMPGMRRELDRLSI